MDDKYIDINCSGTIKSKFTIEDVFKKITNYLKRNKNKVWACQLQDDTITINFNDGISDEFVLSVEKNKFCDYCRVSYDEMADETTLEKLLDMLFAIKRVFRKIEVDDDYSICEAYLKSKEIKIELVDLTEQDIATVNKIYNDGYKDYREFLLTYIARGLNLATYKDLYVNANVVERILANNTEELYKEMVFNALETWLYETALYKQQRFYENEFHNVNNRMEYHALGSIAFDMVACCNGIQRIISKSVKKTTSFGIRDAHVQKLYREKVAEMLNQEENQYEQCVIAYRFLKSIMRYTNFEFVGKDESRNHDTHYVKVTTQNGTFTVLDAFENALKQG